MTFAKLFDRPGFGQVLAKIDRDTDGSPELRWFVSPPDLGVCSFAFEFTDDDAGWDLAEAAFAKADEVKADEAASYVFNLAGIPLPKEPTR